MSKLIRGMFKRPPPPIIDTTPPSNPTSLGVTNVSNVPHLAFTGSTDNVQVVGYQIWRKTGSGGTYAPIDITLTTTYDDHGAPAGSTYFYKVLAYDSVLNLSGFSNEVSIAVSTSDVTAPNIPAQPAAATINNTVNPPTYTTNWATGTDIDPGDGSPVAGMQDYLVYHDYPAANTLQGVVAQPGTVGAAVVSIIGTNNGGALLTGSDNGAVISATSTTGDTNAQQWGPQDEYLLSGIQFQGAGSVVIQITGITSITGYDWSKRGIELRKDLSAGAPFCNLLYFGAAQGMKGEQRTTAGGQAGGGAQVAQPALPLWLKLTWDNNWNVTRSYSTNSTNGTDGTWIVYDTIAMGWTPGSIAYVHKFVDPSTVGATGGTVSMTYAHYAVTPAASVSWAGQGVAGHTINVTVKGRDKAGNISAASTSRAMTFAGAGQIDFPVTGIWNAQLGRDNTYLQTLGKYNFITFTAWLIQQAVASAASTMQTVKSYANLANNPLCKTTQYSLPNEWFKVITDAGAFDNARIAMINRSAYWWLVNNFASATKVTSQDGPPRIATNVSNTSPVVNVATVGSVSGPGNVNLVQALAWLDFQQYVLGKSQQLNASDPVLQANPYLDGFVRDNNETSPYVSGCWHNDATVYTCSAGAFNATVAPWVAGGYKQGIDMLRSLYPTTPSGSEFLLGGNCDGFNFGASAVYDAALHGLYNIPLAEQPFGNFEANGGANFNSFLAGLAAFEVVLKAGTNNFVLGLIEAQSRNVNWTSNNQSSWTAADWRAFRYQAAIFVMMGWAVVIDISTRTTVWQFDELFGGSAVNTYNWMGQPGGARSLVKWLNLGTYGVFKRDFANGSIIINPKGNGAQTFNLPYSGHFLASTGSFGDPAYNTGAAFTAATTMTLQDRDAIFIRNT